MDVKITTTSAVGTDVKVEVDGEDWCKKYRVTGVDVNLAVGEANKVIMTFIPDSVEFDGKVPQMHRWRSEPIEGEPEDAAWPDSYSVRP